MPHRSIVLASASPRRRELLGQIVENFEILVSNVDEEELTCDDPRLTAERLAEAKAWAVAELRPDATVIGADTVVAYEQDGNFTMLAKPMDEEDAVRMLRELSGRTHFVITGVAVSGVEGTEVFSERTDVEFRELSDKEIREYVATGEPMDKAGAYAIQGGAAGFVVRTDGSLSNVIGLPIERLQQLLESIRSSAQSL
ncbi:MAG TPA: Maf family protein [Fimbriimonas sp.]|nr:Maf family protein [Fimbriimonas sp.]